MGGEIAVKGTVQAPDFGALAGRARRDPGESASVAPAFPAAGESLSGAVFPRRIAPPQPIAIDEYFATENAAIIDAGLAMAPGEGWLQTPCLCIRQPATIARRSGLVAEPVSCQSTESTGLDPATPTAPAPPASG